MTSSAPPRAPAGGAPLGPAPSTGRGRGAAPGLLGAAGCGALGSLAFPSPGVWPLLPIAVAGLTLLTRGGSARRGALVGLIAGVGYFAPLLWWQHVVAAEAYVALAALQALSWAVLGLGLAVVQRLRWWPLWAVAVWVLVELLRASLPFGGFPWGRLAFGVTGSPALGWAALGGAAGVSAVVALCGQLLAWAALHVRGSRGRGVARVLAGLAAAALLLAAGAVVPRPVAGTPIRVAAVQGDVPALGVGPSGPRSQVLRNHVALTEGLAEQVRAGRLGAPDLVVWPENASDVDPFRDADVRALIDRAVDAVGVPVLVGTLVLPGDASTIENTGIVWRPGSGPGERYVKRHLVPFGEYIPLRGVLGGANPLLALIPRDFQPGTRAGVLRVGPAVVGDVICFEVAFDGLFRDVVAGGADLLVVQTNNATYGGTAQPEQQFEISRLRAVEHGRALVVAATSGISGAIAPDGAVLARTGEHVAALVDERVPLRTERTVADRLGPWPERALALLGAGAVLAGLVRRRRAGREVAS